MKYFCEMIVLLAVFDLFIDILQLCGLHSALIHTSLDDLGTDMQGILTAFTIDGLCIALALPGWISSHVKACRILSVIGTVLFLAVWVYLKTQTINVMPQRIALINLICFAGYLIGAFTSKQ